MVRQALTADPYFTDQASFVATTDESCYFPPETSIRGDTYPQSNKIRNENS